MGSVGYPSLDASGGPRPISRAPERCTQAAEVRHVHQRGRPNSLALQHLQTFLHEESQLAVLLEGCKYQERMKAEAPGYRPYQDTQDPPS